MVSKYIIQNIITKEYWYGHYTNKHWTDDVSEAVLFSSEDEAENWIQSNGNEFAKVFFTVIKIWTQCLQQKMSVKN